MHTHTSVTGKKSRIFAQTDYETTRAPSNMLGRANAVDWCNRRCCYSSQCDWRLVHVPADEDKSQVKYQDYLTINKMQTTNTRADCKQSAYQWRWNRWKLWQSTHFFPDWFSHERKVVGVVTCHDLAVGWKSQCNRQCTVSSIDTCHMTALHSCIFIHNF